MCKHILLDMCFVFVLLLTSCVHLGQGQGCGVGVWVLLSLTPLSGSTFRPFFFPHECSFACFLSQVLFLKHLKIRKNCI